MRNVAVRAATDLVGLDLGVEAFLEVQPLEVQPRRGGRREVQVKAWKRDSHSLFPSTPSELTNLHSTSAFLSRKLRSPLRRFPLKGERLRCGCGPVILHKTPKAQLVLFEIPDGIR